VSEFFIGFLLKALQQTPIHSSKAKIIPLCKKDAFLADMRLANSSLGAEQRQRDDSLLAKPPNLRFQ